MGGSADTVRFAELRRMLRLLGELRDLPCGSDEQKRHAVRGLCDLVGAKVGLWLDLAWSPGCRAYTIVSALDLGWADEGERRMFLGYLHEQRRSVDPSHAPLAERMQRPLVSASRRELLDDRAWYGSEHVQEFRRPGGCDDFIYVGRTVAADGSRAQGFSVHRAWGDRPFSTRERRLLEVFHDECAFMLRPPSPVPEPVLADLPPRLRDVLCALARGLSEKEVAAELCLSPHTVHDYAKALHRRFGVASRGELLVACLGARHPQSLSRSGPVLE